MSSPRRNFWIAFSALGGLVVAGSVALPACSQAPTPEPAPEHQSQIGALSGPTLTSVTWWLIAPAGTTTSGTASTTGTISGNNLQARVVVSGLPSATTYQLVASGVASDGITGCSGSKTFTTPLPSTGWLVPLACTSTDSGQLLLTNTIVNSCPVIDGVSANPASVVVGGTMALGVTVHDPDSGPAALTYQWIASSGTLTGDTTATPTFTCTQAGTVTITVTPSDSDADCGVNLPFTVACTGP